MLNYEFLTRSAAPSTLPVAVLGSAAPGSSSPRMYPAVAQAIQPTAVPTPDSFAPESVRESC